MVAVGTAAVPNWVAPDSLYVSNGVYASSVFLSNNYGGNIRGDYGFGDDSTRITGAVPAGWIGIFTASTERLHIDTSGHVGIGQNNPTHLLQLGADDAAKPGTSTWTVVSDERLKDIRAPFTRGLDALFGIHTVYYRYKSDNPLGYPSDKEYVGIIAQDALKVIPEAVTKDKNGYYQVTNDAIIWTILNAAKELYQKMTALGRQLASLEAQTAQKADQAAVDALKAESEAKDSKIRGLEQENAVIKAYLCSKDRAAPFCK
jgi:hypothetical protein